MASIYFTEEHELFRQSVRQFIETEVVPRANEWEEKQQIDKAIWKRMGDLGFLGINFPEEYGGTNADFFNTVVLLEETARSTMGGFAAAHGVHQYMATAHLLKAGSAELKKKYLPKAISGEAWGSLAISEPNAGSDVAAIKTTAVRVGDEYIINGSKTFITNGYYGDFVTLACKTAPEQGMSGISLIMVDQNIPGFKTNKLKKMGWHSSDTAELFFDNVRVPASNLIGEENKGFYYIMESFQLERLVAGIGGVAGAQHCLELTLKYIAEREAFGRPIKKFQVLRHKLVDLATEIEAARQLVYQAAWLYSKGEMAVKECSMIKLLATELGKKVADECLQCFGGYGYMEEYTIARMYRDARVGTIVGGTSEIMKEILAKIVIDDVQYKSAYSKSKGESQKSEDPSQQSEVSSQPQTTNISNNSNNSNNNQKSKKMEKASEIIKSLPERFKADKAQGVNTRFHFEIEGETGGHFTAIVVDGVCTVEEGLNGEAKCVVRAKATDYEDVELGRTNPQMAVMMGKIKISNLGEMMGFVNYFKRLTEQ
ncbi:MAG: acyl-CoA dehydrogenase family protein [Bacteroidia bacterium]